MIYGVEDSFLVADQYLGRREARRCGCLCFEWYEDVASHNRNAELRPFLYMLADHPNVQQSLNERIFLEYLL
jgi:hypothetical protein